MAKLGPYLCFNGNAREAMEFYKSCLGGELMLSTFGDVPAGNGTENFPPDQIMHAFLKNGDIELMASDAMPGQSVEQKGAITLSLQCTTGEEADVLFAKLSEGGQITMPLAPTFWAEKFGMCKDKFGMDWMINVDKPHG